MTHISRAEYLEDLAEVLDTCRNYPAFVPVVVNGLVSAARTPPPVATDITVEDYILGSEALGLTYRIIRSSDGGTALLSSTNFRELPPAWRECAWQLISAFRPGTRTAEIVQYLESRNDAGRVEGFTTIGEATETVLDRLARQAVEGADEERATP